MSNELDLAAIVLVVILILVPGSGLALLVHPPGTASLPVRIGLSFAFGYATLALVAFTLALFHVLTPSAFVPTVAAITVVVWLLDARGLRAHGRAIADELRRTWSSHVAFVVVLVGAFFVRATYTPLDNLVPTTLRYWTDALEIADAHGFPEATYQWNAALPPTTSKALLNVFQGAMSFLIGRDALASPAVLLFVCSIALLFLAYGWAHELGIRWVAVVLPILLFLNLRIGHTELTLDLGQNRAENWGRIMLLAGLIFVVRAIKPRRRSDGADDQVTPPATTTRDAILAGVMLAAAAGTHLIPMAIGLAFAGSYAVARMVIDRRFTTVLRACAIGLGVFLVFGVAVLALPRGDLGFRGAGGDGGYDEMLDRLGLPPTFDPTYYLVYNDLDRASDGFPYGPTGVVRDVLRRTWSEDDFPRGGALSRVLLLIPMIVGGLAVVALIMFGDADLRAIAVASALFGATLVAVGILFALRYDLFALETFANRRLFNYTPLPFALVAVALGDLLLRRVASRSEGRPAWRMPAISTAACLVVAALIVPTSVDQPFRGETYESDVELIEWVSDRATCDQRILVDRRTLATFEGMGGRVGVLEGMGPHVRPDVLEVALAEIFDARSFFRYPAGGAEYLQRRGVGYVVVTKPGHPLGGWQSLRPSLLDELGQVSYERFDEAPFLRKVFENDAGLVYEVVGLAEGPALDDPSAYPVYCRP